jgi:hypothetical protein
MLILCKTVAQKAGFLFMKYEEKTVRIQASRFDYHSSLSSTPASGNSEYLILVAGDCRKLSRKPFQINPCRDVGRSWERFSTEFAQNHLS